MKVVALAGAGGGLLLALLPAGCGREVKVLDTITGTRVAAMAERELEAENPRLAAGTLRCPDLDFVVGSSVRCLRTTHLDQGRVVKVGGTVAVTSLDSGGRLHVRMDDRAEEFGLDGTYVAADLGRQYEQRYHVTPTHLECPYLRGRIGARVSCRLEVGGARHDVGVTVTAVDAATYRTSYAVGPLGAAG